MSNVYSLAARRARTMPQPQPVVSEPEEDIAFPSDDAPVVARPSYVAAEPDPESERIYSPEEVAPGSDDYYYVGGPIAAPAEPLLEPQIGPVAPAEPSGDIQYHADRLELAVPIAAALLAFASKDTTRAHLGIGIEGSMVCATDGHTLVCFEQHGAKPPESMQRTVWSRAVVDTAVKVAKARKSSVVLSYSETLSEQAFPPVAQVVPADGLEMARPIGVNPEYLARLALVAKAVGSPSVRLTSARGEQDPLAFKAGAHEVQATAVIMPMRV